MTRPMTALVSQAQHLTLRSTRQAQAFAIAAVDRLARHPDTDDQRTLGRLWRVQLDLAGYLLGDPAQLLDDAYTHVQRLVTLHQEFAHRLLEVVDAGDRRREVQHALATVIPLPRRSV